jgi:flavin reductase (DIM6/NTAB) family NADH-FMN oxidoreductase RutF/NAD(P)-dependent dehydrogenase (short-subunit alcohol dehydrogenase family)
VSSDAIVPGVRYNMTMDKRIAFITGASRGIGKVCAIDLAKAGFDVAVTARTIQPGEAREHSSTVRESDTTPLPGSLSEVAAAIRDAGQDALVVPADLLDRASLGAAATTVIERWGHVDVVVHNGRYIGPGHMDRFLDTPVELIERTISANVIAPLLLNRIFLPGMIERGGGTIVNITSAAGYGDPTMPAGEGGWGMSYGISKGGFHRVAGFLAVELGDRGIRCFNVQPGLIATERIGQDMAKFGIENVGEPPEVVSRVVTWLATSPDADTLNGETIEAQFFCHRHGLLPGWPGPKPNKNAIKYDRSGARLAELEAGLSESSMVRADERRAVVTPDDLRFREVLGNFVTGVSIITTMDGDEPVGVAANSFTSVSLDPPLILFCVAHSSSTWPRIQRAGKFAVNILGDHQEELCRLFATKGADRFGHTPWRAGVSGSPVLEDSIAYLDCVIENEHASGDHTIVVGRVLDLDAKDDARPLLFHRGAYARVHSDH